MLLRKRRLSEPDHSLPAPQQGQELGPPPQQGQGQGQLQEGGSGQGAGAGAQQFQLALLGHALQQRHDSALAAAGADGLPNTGAAGAAAGGAGGATTSGAWAAVVAAAEAQASAAILGGSGRAGASAPVQDIPAPAVPRPGAAAAAGVAAAAAREAPEMAAAAVLLGVVGSERLVLQLFTALGLAYTLAHSGQRPAAVRQPLAQLRALLSAVGFVWVGYTQGVICRVHYDGSAP